VPSINTSLRFNVIFNAIFGTASGGTMSVTNNGNVPTLPVFTISGPVTNPMIYIPSTNQYMKFNIQLLAGDSLVIDTVMSTVTLNGSASRFNTIATGSQWLSFPVGTTSIVVSSSDGTYPTGNLFSVQYRDAYGWC
jgi:phage-related protein